MSFDRVLQTFDADPLLSDAQKAGFVAYLVMLSGAEAPPEQAAAYVAQFCQLAGLDDAMDQAARQAATDAFFQAHPLPPSLRALLTESDAVDGPDRGADALLGVTRNNLPLKRQDQPGTMPGGVLGMLAVRTKNKNMAGGSK